MPVSEDLKRFHGEAGPEQRLRALRRALLQPTLTVQGVAALLNQIDPDVLPCLPESVPPHEFSRLVEWLMTAANDLQEVLAALPAEEGDAAHPSH